MLSAHAADPLTWDGVDLKDAFGIPDVVMPVRLPDDETLTALAAAVPLLADLSGLARDVRETPLRAASVDLLLLGLAAKAELVERGGDTLLTGDDVEWLDDLTEGAAALDEWDYVLAQVLDTTLEAADQAELRVGEDLDLAGHGIALLGQLEKPSAVTVADGAARLEPLALHSVAAKLRACDVHVPDLPPAAEMTPGDVVLLSMLGTEEDFAADFASWVANRTPRTPRGSCFPSPRARARRSGRRRYRPYPGLVTQPNQRCGKRSTALSCAATPRWR